MPWKVMKRDEKWCVIKEDDGSTVACHDSEGEADDQVKALYASENKAVLAGNYLLIEGVRVPVIFDGVVAKQAFTAPSGNVTDTPEVEQARFERIWDRVKERLGWKSDEEQTGFKVQGNHWMAVWSNNFKDRDGEVFPESAIDAYVQRVDIGVVKLPELWVWHAGKSTAIGAADWVGRHGHFVMAGGQFYGGAPAQAAKAYYSKHARNTGISHGYTYPAESFDGKHYDSFNTFEISLLPRGTEANWFTSLEGVKAMPLDDKKVKYLKDVFGEEHATRILEDWDKRGKALEELNVEYKDFVQPEAGEVATDKAAAERADQTFGELVPDLMEGSAEAVTAALEAVKLVKAQNAEIAALKREVAETKALVEQRPRASANPETEVQTSHLSAELQKNLKEQNTVRDAFWGTEVVKP